MTGIWIAINSSVSATRRRSKYHNHKLLNELYSNSKNNWQLLHHWFQSWVRIHRVEFESSSLCENYVYKIEIRVFVKKIKWIKQSMLHILCLNSRSVSFVDIRIYDHLCMFCGN